jgi:hypothetical protein
MYDCPSQYYLYFKLKTVAKPELRQISTYRDDPGAREDAKRILDASSDGDSGQVEAYALFQLVGNRLQDTKLVEFVY